MKLKSFKFQNSTLFYEIPDYTVEMDKTQFIIFLDRILPKSFTISTNNHEYKCNKLGIKSSFVIKDQLEKDPHLNSYHFNFDDEFGIFQQICNFFNFQSIEINTDNMHAIKEIANDLQINCIIDEISNIIKSYEVVVNTIDEKNFLIDPVIELCKNLCEIKSIGIEKVQEKISMSIWSTTKENVQELVCYLIQVIHNDLSLHPYIMNLITSLDKKATEENDLKILLPSFLKQIMLLFPYNKNNCAFVFRLVNKGLVSISEIINKLALAIEKNEEQKNYSYSKFSEKDNFISKLTCPFKTNPNINLIELKNAIVWFFPEVSSIKGAESIINDAKMNEFLHKYFPDKIEDFRKMRESDQPDDEIVKAIINDDVDILQKIMNNHPSLTTVIPYNLFDSLSEEENVSFINYAALNGSIKCFKFLLLNHSVIDKSSLYYAVLGKNIEIIRIVDQDYNKKGIDADYCFNSYDFYHKKIEKYKIFAPIFPAIIKHQNDVFDWILEQKYINKDKTNNALFDIALLAVQNGNAHDFIQCVDKGFDLNSLPIKKISQLIEQSAYNGFCRLTNLIISLLNQEKLNENLLDLLKFEDSVFCGNLLLVKIYFSIDNAFYNIEKGLCIAIERGYLHIIKDLFETDFVEKIGINDNGIVNVFVKAIQNQQTEIFNYLYNQTNLVNILKPDSLFTLLSYSCYIGDLKITQLLTDFIIEKNIDRDFSNPFLCAACSDHDKFCQYFFDRKVVINYTDLAMQKSILTCCKKSIFIILFNSVDPEVKETFLRQFLNESIKNKNVEVVDFLLQEEDSHEDTLFEAISTKNSEIVNIVLKHNSKPSFINQLSEDGTALNKAVILNEYDIVKRLLSVPGIDPNLYSENHITPLVSAISNFNLDIINLILDFYGEKIESQKWQLDEALGSLLRIISGEQSSSHPYFVKQEIYFHQTDDYEPDIKKKKVKELILSILKRLIQIKNINLNCYSKKYTLLSYACETNEIEMVSMLIKEDQIDVNFYAPKNGKTPLMISIENENIEIAKLLIKLPKTNINIRSYHRKTALIIAVEKNLEEIVELIINNEKFEPEESLLGSAFAISEGQISKQLFSLSSLNVNYKFIDKDDIGNQYNEFDDRIMGLWALEIPDKDKMDPYSFETSLIRAVNKNDLEKINQIINHPSFDPIKSQIKGALFASVKNKNINIFRSLLSKLNNDVNIYSQAQESLFSYSIRCGSEIFVEEIINNDNFNPDKANILNAFINAYSKREQDSDKKMRISLVNISDDKKIDAPMELMKLLCKFDEEHNHLIDFTKLLPNDKSFFTAMNPNLRNNGDVATFLMNHGVDPDKPDNFGEYPLKYFIQNNMIDAAISLIISAEVDLIRRFTVQIGNEYIGSTYHGLTYLHIAASLPTSEILSILIDMAPFLINCEDSSGETPLIKAVANKSIQNIKLLFSNENLNYKYCYNRNIDIIEVAKSLVNYTSLDVVQLESKEDYLEYLIHILSVNQYYPY